MPPVRWATLSCHELAYPLDRLTIVRSDDALLSALQRVEGADVAHALVVDPAGRIVGTLDPSALQRALQPAPSEPEPARV